MTRQIEVSSRKPTIVMQSSDIQGHLRALGHGHGERVAVYVAGGQCRVLRGELGDARYLEKIGVVVSA
jgi:hypothetical protein